MLTQPTLAGFIAFLRAVPVISTAVLPDDSPTIPWALALAIQLVNQQLTAVCMPGPPIIGLPQVSIYVSACYNLATDNLFTYAQDLPDAPIIPGSDPPAPFFKWSRQQWNILGFTSGVVQASSDESTSVSMVVQDAAKNFTLQDLQSLKTPYGRTYLGLAQAAGPTTWGIS